MIESFISSGFFVGLVIAVIIATVIFSHLQNAAIHETNENFAEQLRPVNQRLQSGVNEIVFAPQDSLYSGQSAESNRSLLILSPPKLINLLYALLFLCLPSLLMIWLFNKVAGPISSNEATVTFAVTALLFSPLAIMRIRRLKRKVLFYKTSLVYKSGWIIKEYSYNNIRHIKLYSKPSNRATARQSIGDISINRPAVYCMITFSKGRLKLKSTHYNKMTEKILFWTDNLHFKK